MRVRGPTIATFLAEAEESLALLGSQLKKSHNEVRLGSPSRGGDRRRRPLLQSAPPPPFHRGAAAVASEDSASGSVPEVPAKSGPSSCRIDRAVNVLLEREEDVKEQLAVQAKTLLRVDRRLQALEVRVTAPEADATAEGPCSGKAAPGCAKDVKVFCEQQFLRLQAETRRHVEDLGKSLNQWLDDTEHGLQMVWEQHLICDKVPAKPSEDAACSASTPVEEHVPDHVTERVEAGHLPGQLLESGAARFDVTRRPDEPVRAEFPEMAVRAAEHLMAAGRDTSAQVANEAVGGRPWQGEARGSWTCPDASSTDNPMVHSTAVVAMVPSLMDAGVQATETPLFAVSADPCPVSLPQTPELARGGEGLRGSAQVGVQDPNALKSPTPSRRSPVVAAARRQRNNMPLLGFGVGDAGYLGAGSILFGGSRSTADAGLQSPASATPRCLPAVSPLPTASPRPGGTNETTGEAEVGGTTGGQDTGWDCKPAAAPVGAEGEGGAGQGSSRDLQTSLDARAEAAAAVADTAALAGSAVAGAGLLSEMLDELVGPPDQPSDTRQEGNLADSQQVLETDDVSEMLDERVGPPEQPTGTRQEGSLADSQQVLQADDVSEMLDELVGPPDQPTGTRQEVSLADSQQVLQADDVSEMLDELDGLPDQPTGTRQEGILADSWQVLQADDVSSTCRSPSHASSELGKRDTSEAQHLNKQEHTAPIGFDANTRPGHLLGPDCSPPIQQELSLEAEADAQSAAQSTRPCSAFVSCPEGSQHDLETREAECERTIALLEVGSLSEPAMMVGSQGNTPQQREGRVEEVPAEECPAEGKPAERPEEGGLVQAFDAQLEEEPAANAQTQGRPNIEPGMAGCISDRVRDRASELVPTNHAQPNESEDPGTAGCTSEPAPDEQARCKCSADFGTASCAIAPPFEATPRMDLDQQMTVQREGDHPECAFGKAAPNMDLDQQIAVQVEANRPDCALADRAHDECRLEEGVAVSHELLPDTDSSFEQGIEDDLQEPAHDTEWCALPSTPESRDQRPRAIAEDEEVARDAVCRAEPSAEDLLDQLLQAVEPEEYERVKPHEGCTADGWAMQSISSCSSSPQGADLGNLQTPEEHERCNMCPDVFPIPDGAQSSSGPGGGVPEFEAEDSTTVETLQQSRSAVVPVPVPSASGSPLGADAIGILDAVSTLHPILMHTSIDEVDLDVGGCAMPSVESSSSSSSSSPRIATCSRAKSSENIFFPEEPQRMEPAGPTTATPSSSAAYSARTSPRGFIWTTCESANAHGVSGSGDGQGQREGGPFAAAPSPGSSAPSTCSDGGNAAQPAMLLLPPFDTGERIGNAVPGAGAQTFPEILRDGGGSCSSSASSGASSPSSNMREEDSGGSMRTGCPLDGFKTALASSPASSSGQREPSQGARIQAIEHVSDLSSTD